MNDGLDDTSHVWGSYGTTVLHPVFMVFMLCMLGLVLFSPRSRAILAVLLVCVFIPNAQRLVIGGLDFSMLRVILIVAWARVLVRGEYRGFKANRLDRVLVLWIASAAIIQLLRTGGGSFASTVATSVDALNAFFLFRVLVRNREDVFVLTRQLAWIAIAFGVFAAFELVAQYNVFSALSGEPPTPQFRGRVRCKGAISHPILAGTFGAVLVPIFVALFRGHRKQRALFGGAILAASVIVVAAGSSGPLVAWGVGLLAWGLWRHRGHTRAFLWTMAGVALVIHLIREKPVWSLVGKLSKVTGGTGYHRSRLIDAFVERFTEWALLGTNGTAHWGWGLRDTTNQYVTEGTRGGLLTLVMFVLLLHVSFSRLRRARVWFERVEGPRSLFALLAWGFSVSLALNCVSFMSVSYFGQMRLFFLMFLAQIAALSLPRRRVRTASTTPRSSGLESSEVSASRHPRPQGSRRNRPPNASKR